METERRINFRLGQDLYKQLDDKRHAEGQTWQALGIAFFTEWLFGVRSTPPPLSTSRQLTEDDRNTADRLLWWVMAAQKGELGIKDPAIASLYQGIADVVLHQASLIRSRSSGKVTVDQ